MAYYCHLFYRAGMAFGGRLRRIRLQLSPLPTTKVKPTRSSAPKMVQVKVVQTQAVQGEAEQAEAVSAKEKVEEKKEVEMETENRGVEKEAATQGDMDWNT